MISFDLRWFVYGGLALILVAAAIAYGVGKWTEQSKRMQRTIHWLTPALDAAPVGILVFSNQNQLLYANATAYQLLGMRAGETSLPPALWERFDQPNAALKESDPEFLSLSWRRLDFTLSASEREMTLTSWFASIPEATIAIVRDLSPMLASAREAQMIFGGLSHELRTPLATIATHIEVLRVASLPAEAREQSLRFMSDEIQRLARLVSNTMELGRLESGIESDLQPVDLVRIAEEARTQMESIVRATGTTIFLSAQAPLPMILGQPDRLKQVFLNLLDNAIKYGASDKPIEIRITATKQGVHCVVEDHGVGVATDQIPLLTQRFYRVSAENIPGNGLGLAIVEAILRQHGSRLQIASTPALDPSNRGEQEQGTTFCFTLPWNGAVVHHA